MWKRGSYDIEGKFVECLSNCRKKKLVQRGALSYIGQLKVCVPDKGQSWILFSLLVDKNRNYYF